MSKQGKREKVRSSAVHAKLSVLVPSQIRALRLRQGISQKQLAEKAGMLPPRVSMMEVPGAANFTLGTLARIAAAFNAGVVVQFVSYGAMVEWENGYSQDTFDLVAPRTKEQKK